VLALLRADKKSSLAPRPWAPFQPSREPAALAQQLIGILRATSTLTTAFAVAFAANRLVNGDAAIAPVRSTWRRAGRSDCSRVLRRRPALVAAAFVGDRQRAGPVSTQDNGSSARKSEALASATARVRRAVARGRRHDFGGRGRNRLGDGVQRRLRGKTL
jgi:hypothetical protein